MHPRPSEIPPYGLCGAVCDRYVVRSNTDVNEHHPRLDILRDIISFKTVEQRIRMVPYITSHASNE